MSGYDIIGDVHGHADKLVALLRKLGYRERGGAWRHASRTAVFVGDLIDRGPDQRRSVNIPRAMVDAGAALAVIGNHEFNAVAYDQWNPDRDDYCRPRQGPRGEKNRKQHAAFLDQLDKTARDDALAWFRTLPLWLDLDGLRVLHACWHEGSMRHLESMFTGSNSLTDDIVHAGSTRGNPTYDAIETVLKGPEIDMGGRAYLDKDGVERRQARQAWWDASAVTLRQAAIIPNNSQNPDGTKFDPLPDTPLDESDQRPYTGESPVFVGHYWASGVPERWSPRVACVDYSVGKGGPLVAYRWDGEPEILNTKFVST